MTNGINYNIRIGFSRATTDRHHASDTAINSVREAHKQIYSSCMYMCIALNVMNCATLKVVEINGTKFVERHWNKGTGGCANADV